MLRLLSLFVGFGLLISSLPGQAALTGHPDQVDPHLVYGVRVAEGDRDAYHLSLEVLNPAAKDLRFVIPHWAPGAYREITGEVRSGGPAWKSLVDFAAVDQDEKSLTVTPDGDRAWKVEAAGARRVKLSYRNTGPGRRANNRSYLAEQSGLIDGPRNWVYLDGFKHLPCSIRFELPKDWRVASGLDPTFDPMVFHADDYDRLADCPTAVGLFHERIFHVRGIAHRVVAVTGGKDPGRNFDAFTDKVRRIVEAYVRMFNDVPHQHYTFIYTDGGGGGLEHLTSTTISAGRADALGDSSLGVTAHEFFHTWNVKRLRPIMLGPFDYTQPVRSKDLWISEGITNYYTNIGLWRAGLRTDQQFLDDYAGTINGFVRNPASLFVPPEESSWTVWDRGGGAISYYTQGEVLGLMIDLLVRGSTGNRKSFDDVMRRTYRKFGGYYRHGPALPGFKSEEFLAEAIAETGVDLEPFWNAHVRGSEPIDWNRYFEAAGWKLDIQDGPQPLLATARRMERHEQGVILVVESGDPLDRSGFKNGDIVASFNGTKTTAPRQLSTSWRTLAVGGSFEAEVKRGDKLEKIKGQILAANEFDGLVLREEEGRIRVVGVPCGTAMHSAGLRDDDILVVPNGTKLPEFEAKLATMPIGETVTFEVRRGEETKKIAVKAAPRRVLQTGRLSAISEPTSAQLAVREGLKTGATSPVTVPK